MVTKLGPSGSELVIAEPDVCRRVNEFVGVADRGPDGQLGVDYRADKDVWQVEWDELSEDQLTGANGVLTAADRTKALNWLPPDEGVSLEDETGADWGKDHAGRCFAGGSAFARAEGVDLSPWAGVEGSSTPYMLDLVDPSGLRAVGFIGAADAVESLGSELVTNGNMEAVDSWPNYGTPTTNERSTEQVHGDTYSRKLVTDGNDSEGMQQSISATVEKLYKIVAWIYVASGGPVKVSWDATDLATLATTGQWVQITRYRTFEDDGTYLRFYTAAGVTATFYVDDVSLKEVVHVGADGVHIVSTRDGSTRNWQRIDTSFDRNAAYYTFDVHGAYQTVQIGDREIRVDPLDTEPLRFYMMLEFEEQ